MQTTPGPEDTQAAQERSESGEANDQAMEETQEQAAEEREQARGYQ
jgi:hypothetical protein